MAKTKTKKKQPKPDKVELLAWVVTERMEHNDELFTREDTNNGTTWFFEGGVDEVDDYKLLNTLEEEYQKSKQGYVKMLFKK